eukprot:TRINITY_DN4684_c9_g1_i1.p2 TRINITY_DN4684_c9_g1~~TRINITY_DN4684_c9_g1_i1.p2  ORF type:complete len:538 (+),score=146.12 TRINITY_DN4684_c9_g1_i1:110-1615(+)
MPQAAQRDAQSASRAGAAAASRFKRGAACVGAAAAVAAAVATHLAPDSAAAAGGPGEQREHPPGKVSADAAAAGAGGAGDGAPDAPLPPRSERTDAALAVLFHEDRYLPDLLRSLCARMPHAAPLFFFHTEEDTAQVATARPVAERALGRKGRCAGRWDLRWELVPESLWNQSGPAMYSRRMPVYYRRMIWFWTYGVLTLEALRPFRWLLRLDTDSAFATEVTLDPFAHLAAQGAVYGYVSACYDSPDFVAGLWHHVQWEMQVLRVGQPRHADYVFPTSCRLSVKREKCRFPHPMFWTNFEVLDLNFWRSEPVMQFLESTHRGVFYERWGDAPIRAAAVALFASPKQVVHLNYFAYTHGRCSSDGGPTSCRRRTLHVGNRNRAVWTAEVSGVETRAALSAKEKAKALAANGGLPVTQQAPLLRKPLTGGAGLRIRREPRRPWWNGQCWDDRPLPVPPRAARDKRPGLEPRAPGAQRQGKSSGGGSRGIAAAKPQPASRRPR